MAMRSRLPDPDSQPFGPLRLPKPPFDFSHHPLQITRHKWSVFTHIGGWNIWKLQDTRKGKTLLSLFQNWEMTKKHISFTGEKPFFSC